MEIALTQGKVALIDDEDWPLVGGFGWGLYHGQYGGFYALATNMDRARRRPKMHRLIMSCPVGYEVDHRNGDGLDNRRANLRIATRAENMRNKGKRSNNKSGFKGVFRSKHGWRARLRVSGKDFHLGCFAVAEDAARAYDVAARLFHGEFAWPNFP